MKLKRPILVYLLAICFLLSPIGNIIIPLYRSRVEGWYNPQIWWMLFLNLPWFQKVFLVSLPVSGGLLLAQKKTTWFFALFLLAIISAQNFVFGANLSLYLFGIVNGSFLIVLFYFRFPYLDKRDHILAGEYKRYDVNIKATIEGSLKDGLIRNISETGCFFEFTDELQMPKVGHHDRIKFEGRVFDVEVVFVRGRGFGMKFVSLSKTNQQQIRSICQPQTIHKKSA